MKLIIIGTGGLAKQCLPLIIDKMYSFDVLFVNSFDNKISHFDTFNVIHSLETLKSPFKFIICIGSPIHREKLYKDLIDLGGIPMNLISKDSNIFQSKIGIGNIILSNSLMEKDSIIGNGNLINCYSGLFHDVKIGDFNEIMPGVKLLGGSVIGSSCRIGTNSTILPNINICDDVIVGAGAVVINNIIESGTYVGVPAKKIK